MADSDVCQIFVRFQGGGRWRSAEHQPSAGRFFFGRVNAFTLIFLGNDIRRNTLIVCDPEATPYKYLASIRIKATAATIRNPKPQYAIRTGAGGVCLNQAFMLGGPSRDDAAQPRPSACESVAPTCNWMRQSNARKKTDRDHCCFSADHRTYRSMLGDGLRSGYLVGIPALTHDQL